MEDQIWLSDGSLSISHGDDVILGELYNHLSPWFLSILKRDDNNYLLHGWQKLILHVKHLAQCSQYGQFSQFSRSVVSNSLRPHESQHTRPPCPSPTPGVYPNSCPSSRWCHPAISSPVVPFSSCPQSLPASGTFPMSQLFAWGGQSFGVSASASVLPMNTQDWYPLGWTGWISLQSKEIVLARRM